METKAELVDNLLVHWEACWFTQIIVPFWLTDSEPVMTSSQELLSGCTGDTGSFRKSSTVFYSAGFLCHCISFLLKLNRILNRNPLSEMRWTDLGEEKGSSDVGLEHLHHVLFAGAQQGCRWGGLVDGSIVDEEVQPRSSNLLLHGFNSSRDALLIRHVCRRQSSRNTTWLNPFSTP